MTEKLENPKIEEITFDDIKIQSDEIGELMIIYHEVYWHIIYKYRCKSNLPTKEFCLKFSLKCILSRRLRRIASLTRGFVWILLPHDKSFSILWVPQRTLRRCITFLDQDSAMKGDWMNPLWIFKLILFI